MQLNFRHGVIKGERDLLGNPQFLTMSPDGVNLFVDQIYLQLTFAHGSANYVHQESTSVTDAWPGPFPVGQDTHLYVDINLQTGVRTFGKTNVAPNASIAPPAAPVQDKHWFDLKNTVMKVYKSNRWIEVVRVFVGRVESGATLRTNPFGSTVGISGSQISAGFILFDDEEKPVKKFNALNAGRFITTETPLASQLMRAANYRLETGISTAQATEHVPKWAPISYKAPNEIGIAKNSDWERPAIGIANEEMIAGEVNAFITAGYAQDASWDWPHPPGTPLWVSEFGELTADVPQFDSVQRVATIVDPNRILVKIEPIMIYE